MVYIARLLIQLQSVEGQLDVEFYPEGGLLGYEQIVIPYSPRNQRIHYQSLVLFLQ